MTKIEQQLNEARQLHRRLIERNLHTHAEIIADQIEALEQVVEKNRQIQLDIINMSEYNSKN